MTMFKYSTAALALFLTAGTTFAQEATPAPANPPAVVDCPAAGSVPEAELSAACKAQLDAANGQVPAPDATTNSGTAATGTTDTQEPAGTMVNKTPDSTATTTAVTDAAKSSSSVLASQFMGQTVWSPSNENVGEINDLVLNRELDTIVAVVGVGGFLGIGEKDVAIPIDQITAMKDANNNLTLKISATKQELEAAPAFDRTVMN